MPEIETLYLLVEFPSPLNSLSKHNYLLKAEETAARRDQVHTFAGAPRFTLIRYEVLANHFHPLHNPVTELKAQRFPNSRAVQLP